MWGDLRRWLAVRQLSEGQRPLMPFAPRPAGQRCSGAGGSGRGHVKGQGTSHRNTQACQPQNRHRAGVGTAPPMRGRGPAAPLSPPPGAALSLAPFCASACLPAIAIPVVHLHLDGPARQRARGGMGLTQHPCGPRMGPFSCSRAREDAATPTGRTLPLSCSRVLPGHSSPRDEGTVSGPFTKG